MVLPQHDATALAIGVAQISADGLALSVAVAPRSLHLPLDEDAEVTAPVQVEGTLTRVAEQIYFQGSVRGVVSMSCSRCLERVPIDFVTDMRVVFLPPTSDIVSASDRGLKRSEELDLYTHDGIMLDLKPLVREHVVLAFPVQPLCREDCAGLCPICGGNRNIERCGCESADDDPRFAILKQLRFPGAS